MQLKGGKDTPDTSAWRKNYRTVDALSSRHDIWNAFSHTEGLFGIDLAPPVHDGERILDAGSGTGVHLRRLIEKFSHGTYFAVDFSSAMVEATRLQCPEAQISQASIEDLPFPNGFF